MELLDTIIATGDISTAFVAATYTAEMARIINVQLYLNGIAGGGNYQAYVTKTLDEGVVTFRSGVTEVEVDAGVTTCYFLGRDLIVAAGDTLQVLVQGLPADIAAEMRIDLYDVSLAADIAAIKAKTDNLGETTVTYTTPVLETGNVVIVQGDVYENVDGRRLEWQSASWSIAPTSTVALIIHGVIPLVAARLSETSVGLELTSSQTLALPEGHYRFAIQEVQADEERITLLSGVWTTLVQPTPVALAD